jgi:flagellar protein FliS
MSSPYAQYRQTAIETATPTRLVVMLYDGAIRFLSSALPEMHARRYDAQTRLIGRAQAIIAHLRDTLDFAQGGAVALDLEACYVALYDALTDANIHDKPERVQQAIDSLRELREAWIEVDRRCQAGKGQTTLSAPATTPAGRALLPV